MKSGRYHQPAWLKDCKNILPVSTGRTFSIGLTQTGSFSRSLSSWKQSPWIGYIFFTEKNVEIPNWNLNCGFGRFHIMQVFSKRESENQDKFIKRRCGDTCRNYAWDGMINQHTFRDTSWPSEKPWRITRKQDVQAGMGWGGLRAFL